tara:strand:+ start:2885 stop:3202 length:318 start_codon:yes stop_codon:yes gene_type:complete
MSFVFRTPEVDSLERGPLQGKRRNELFSMAIERGILTKEHATPTKDQLIVLIESQPADQLISLERAKTLKPFALKKVCKEHGIPVDKKSTREYMLTEYEKVLQEQ